MTQPLQVDADNPVLLDAMFAHATGHPAEEVLRIAEADPKLARALDQRLKLEVR